MNAQDLKIGEVGDVYVITAVGRANFEYAVPIRELVNSNDGHKTIRLDLKECTAMDSTFMGVLSMGALKAADNGTAFEIYNASEALKRNLSDLGVDELFTFSEGVVAEGKAVSGKADMLTMAETVEEAHRKLVEADSSNAERFNDVITYAAADVERLKNSDNK
ncbi:MAG: STAS domain-containing protein [Lentisphaeria bacterium]|nr:STAS domain-containing protein [Lentisphaeria bacterium]